MQGFPIPGYGGYVPSSLCRIGDKLGYAPRLAGNALETDADYAAAAKKQYSEGVPMSSYHAQHGIITTNEHYKKVSIQSKSAASASNTVWEAFLQFCLLFSTLTQVL